MRAGPLVLVALVLMAAAPLPAGIWGAPGAELVVTDTGATLRLECAQATVPAPLRPDADGRFAVRGRFDAVAGGPQPAGDEAVATPNARLAGTVAGARMDLEIRVDGEATPRRYTLERGRRVKLIRCY